MTAALQNFTAPLKAHWQQRSLRERRLMQTGALVLGLAAFWSVALAPAWRTWQAAPAKQAQLDQQTQQMLQLQAQARELQASAPITRAQAIEWLKAHAQDLAPDAKLQVQGDLVLVSFQAAPAQALAEWIGQAREHAHARPVQAQVQQMPLPAKTATPDAPQVMWGGSLQLSLPF
jgi:general secretion pathway protein M